jgi:hypothetical protein
MYYRGKIKAGVVVLEDGATLPEGTPVRVEPVSEETRLDQPEIDPLFRIGELAVDTGISDLSINVDHYLYGHPKVDDAGQ